MGVLAREKQAPRSASPRRGEESKPRNGNGRQGLGSDFHSLIGEQLRCYYADLLREPVPERLLALLEQLDSKEGGRS